MTTSPPTKSLGFSIDAVMVSSFCGGPRSWLGAGAFRPGAFGMVHSLGFKARTISAGHSPARISACFQNCGDDPALRPGSLRARVESVPLFQKRPHSFLLVAGIEEQLKGFSFECQGGFQG